MRSETTLFTDDRTESVFLILLEVLEKLDARGLSAAALHVNDALEQLSPNDPRIPNRLRPDC